MAKDADQGMAIGFLWGMMRTVQQEPDRSLHQGRPDANPLLMIEPGVEVTTRDWTGDLSMARPGHKTHR